MVFVPHLDRFIHGQLGLSRDGAFSLLLGLGKCAVVAADQLVVALLDWPMRLLLRAHELSTVKSKVELFAH